MKLLHRNQPTETEAANDYYDERPLPDEAPETIFPIVAEYLRANYLRIPHGHQPPGPVLVPLGSMPLAMDEEEDPEPVVAGDQEVGPNA